MTTFVLPDLGEGLGEAEIVAWHVSAGDHVVADQPLLSVETDKAVIEIPAPHAGRIARTHGAPGDVVPVGHPLVEFASVAEHDATGSVVGELPSAERPAAHGASTTTDGARASPVRAAPAVRALAERLGVDLRTIAGTGPNGAVSRDDVQRAAGGVATQPPLPLRGVRRAMARNMSRSHAEVVPATLTDVADIDSWGANDDVTLRLVRAIVAGCAAEPALNAWYLGIDIGRRVHERVDIGIAADTEDGLFVPVLRDVGSRDDADLRHGLERMKRDLRTRTIPAQELRDPTITLSNFGMFGGAHAALVVLPPQVCILGAGRIARRVVPRDGAVVIRRMLPLSLTFDHRAVMGGEAARFMAAVVDDLARP